MLAASLGQMMCNLTIGKTKYAAVEPRVREIRASLEQLGARLRELIAEDAASFEAVLAAYRLPKETDEQKAARDREINIATRASIDVPHETARRALEALRLLVELSRIGNPNALPDVSVGSQLALAAVKGAYYNIGINLKSIADRAAAEELYSEAKELVDQAARLADQVEAEMLNRFE
jgi:formiminotetrahydrofolate cyclodeaminase